ncbi:MAG: DEAD/DEAH box helicase family protein [Selenomonadaceae bacterium]|nr:DEAD/DEAH box helicase family protein [Selenomonadaceae bacterium]
MKINLLPFQEDARKELMDALDDARHNYARRHKPQIVSFTAATGAGKTIILISLVESVFNGDENYPAQDDAIFIWLSDSPELNEQSRKKFYDNADDFIRDKLITITDETFDAETLEDGKIYFLNTQKLSRTSNLTRHSDIRQFTIWETLQNTAEEKSSQLYLIIDEAHRGAKNRNDATTIMQKFIKGSAEDYLNPLPLVIGVSATIERFNELVKDVGSAINPCAVSNDNVREAGLLKDRIIVIYPSEKSSANREMSMLTAAAQDWRKKCEHWQAYNSAVKPIFIVQVQSGTGQKISDTDLDECLKTIETATGENFVVGEVVHTFGDAGDLMINGLRVIYEEPSAISSDDAIKIVLFKENLSTGWDCPRAETMMSFRRAVDATYIAQLIGRMIRTPLQRRIGTDETLNEVCLFLPKFNSEVVKEILDKLKNGDFGAVTNIGVQTFGVKNFETWTITPQEISLPEQFPVGGLSLTPLEIPEKISALNREDVLKFINALGLTTYRVKKSKPVNRLKALFELARLLSWSEIHSNALDEVIDSEVKMIREHVEKLKAVSDYNSAIERVLQFKLNAQIINVFGQTNSGGVSKDLFSANESDIDRKYDFALAKLGDEEVANKYLREYGDAEDLTVAKIEIIIFAENNACAEALQKFAEDKYHSFVDAYQRKFAATELEFQNIYDEISASADEISRHNFKLPNVVTDLPRAEDGIEYTDHLFVDEKSGTARIKLNTWEEGTLKEEQSRKDFVCWLRNFDRKSWALCLLYKDEHDVTKNFYPDMIIIRRGADGYIADVLEPHDSTRRDNIGKARALAQYAEENPIIGRLELIRRYKNSFKRLDAMNNEIREKILRASTNAELDNLFDEHGKI